MTTPYPTADGTGSPNPNPYPPPGQSPPPYHQAQYAPPGNQPYPPPQGAYAPPQAYPQGGYPPPGPYPPPQGAYAPAPYGVQPAVVVVTAAPTVPSANDIRWSELPVACICPYCGHAGPTRITYRSGLLTWLACGGLTCLGCILGCCLIPFCVNSCKDVEHHCSGCNRAIGICKKIK